MKNRIRYQPTHQPNIMHSVRMYSVQGKTFSIQIDTHAKSFAIVDAVTKAPIAMGEAKTLHALKIKAKEALESLGVSFEHEARRGKQETH